MSKSKTLTCKSGGFLLLLSMETKYCSLCNTNKSIEEFEIHKSTKDGRRYCCRDCKKEVAKKYRNPKKARELQFRKKYNITLDERNKLSKKQNGKCVICGSDEPLVIDHDHETGKIRGLLCNLCNVGLGSFKDNIDSLNNAIRYLINI